MRLRKQASGTYLGVDPGLLSTGYAVVSGGAVKVFTVSSGKLRGMRRLDFLEKSLLEVLDREAPDEVVVEGYSYGLKGSRVAGIMELGGIYRLAISRRRLPLWEVPPTTLKKFVTGDGRAEKSQVLKEV